jgi:hypothetical protein
MTASRIALIVVGGLTALIALMFLLSGLVFAWAHLAERTDDGYFMTRYEEVATPGYALVSDNLDVDASTPGWLLDQVGEVRISARPRRGSSFVGIARAEDADRYLGSVPHTRVIDVEFEPFRWDTETAGGTAAPSGPPGSQDFWATSASGAGLVELDWEVDTGDWVVVVMNADASRGVGVSVAGGAKAPVLLPVAIAFVVVGLLLGAAAFFFFRLSARGSPPPPEADAA